MIQSEELQPWQSIEAAVGLGIQRNFSRHPPSPHRTRYFPSGLRIFSLFTEITDWKNDNIRVDALTITFAPSVVKRSIRLAVRSTFNLN
jgi:hypothetical protein